MLKNPIKIPLKNGDLFGEHNLIKILFIGRIGQQMKSDLSDVIGK